MGAAEPVEQKMCFSVFTSHMDLIRAGGALIRPAYSTVLPENSESIPALLVIIDDESRKPVVVSVTQGTSDAVISKELLFLNQARLLESVGGAGYITIILCNLFKSVEYINSIEAELVHEIRCKMGVWPATIQAKCCPGLDDARREKVRNLATLIVKFAEAGLEKTRSEMMRKVNDPRGCVRRSQA